MKKQKVETNIVVLVMVVVGLFVFSLFAEPGGLENSMSHSPMGRPFDQTHDVERDGYCRTFVVPPDSNQVIFTVPEGMRFVLLRLHADMDFWMWMSFSESWNLTVDGGLFLNHNIKHVETDLIQEGHDIYKHKVDFPDGLVVIDGGETLAATNNGEKVSLTIIGYFYNVR